MKSEIVNVAISSFNYSPIDQQKKPQVLKIISNTTFKIKQTACEMWNLIRLFPLLFGEHIPTGNEVWNLCISFCQVVERLRAVTFTRGDLAILQFLIDNFLERYVSLFPDVNLKPKAHFLRHYPEMIGRFGPLIKTLRFEAKHGYFKSLFNINKNRKNVFQSMAKRHQFMMFLHYAQDNLLGHKKPHCFGSQEVPVEFFKGPIQAVIRESTCLHGADLITKGYAVELNGQRYNKGEALLLGFDGDEYLFGIIECIIVHKAKVYSLVEKMETVSYHFHFNAYEVIGTTTYLVLDLEKFVDYYHPLGSYNINNMFLIQLRHHVTESYE